MSDLDAKIDAAKVVVSDLKAKHPAWKTEPVAEVDEAIAALKALIGEKKAAEKAAKKAAAPSAEGKKKAGKKGGDDNKKELAMQHAKATQFNEWYNEVIFKAELISSYPISGCYILRPYVFSIWERIQNFMNSEFSKFGVQNCYFPMFVTEDALNREKDHVEGFAAEVAWITKSGRSDLNKKIAIRPTSETVMYPAYAEWIRSHRDLPLKLNQWCNVVRWEFKSPTPFLRTREFLWQEGHTAHATKESADTEVYDILDVYARTYSELLAVPCVKGIKSEKEKFAGGDFTTTVEAYVPYAGRGIQAATSHGLGQNFAKMFGITFENEAGVKQMPYQNSWGFTTRSIGVAIMVHGDDKGLVLPPRVAQTQAVFVPIVMANTDNAELDAAIAAAAAQLEAAGVRTHIDRSTQHNSGFKRNHWEQRGVPLRLEVGPKDLAKQSVLMCVRDNGEKRSVPVAELAATVAAELEAMHARLLAAATKFRDEHIEKIDKWDDFVPALDRRCLVLAPWCREVECEESMKEAQKKLSAEAADQVEMQGDEQFLKITAAAKVLCIPLEQEPLADGAVCFHCGKPAVKRALLGRSY